MIMGNGRRLIRGAFILTAAGLLTRMIGFFYRIFLSHAIGAEGMGIYQLIFPLNMLCYALTVMGIQTAISRFVSAKMALEDPQGANSTFAVGTIYSLLLSGVTAWILYRFAPFLSEKILMEPRTLPMLKLMACSIPMGVIHTCVSGYFFARKKTGPPAISQLLEQTARVAATYLAYTVMLSKGLTPTPVIAVIGMICGELVSMLFSLTAVIWNLQAQDFSLGSIRQPVKILKDILPMSAHSAEQRGGDLDPQPAALVGPERQTGIEHLRDIKRHGHAPGAVPLHDHKCGLRHAAPLRERGPGPGQYAHDPLDCGVHLKILSAPGDLQHWTLLFLRTAAGTVPVP